MKRRIAAILVADVASLSRSLADDVDAARARQDEYRGVISDTLVHGGGKVLSSESDATLLAEFQSAVQAVRAALDAQETLRVRNKELSLAQRLDFNIGITIGEVAADPTENLIEVAPDALADGARLASLAVPGGVCISRSVREAVASKLKGNSLNLLVEGKPFGPDDAAAPYAKSHGAASTARPAATLSSLLAAVPRTRVVIAASAMLVIAVAISISVWRGGVSSKPADERSIATLTPSKPASDVLPAAPKSKLPLAGGGKLEFIPALAPNPSSGNAPNAAPDPALVLSAARMLPLAWRNCRDGSADAAVTACKTLIDSGLVKGDELAETQMLSGRALRDRHEIDKALEALNASIALKPTPSAYSLRGTVHFDKASWDQAISDYSAALRLDPKNGEAFNNRAWTYYRIGKLNLALPDADAAVGLTGKQAYVWDTRGHINAALGNREAAIRDFRSALAIDPASPDSKAGLTKLGAK